MWKVPMKTPAGKRFMQKKERTDPGVRRPVGWI